MVENVSDGSPWEIDVDGSYIVSAAGFVALITEGVYITTSLTCIHA